jgi:hypothetical protein
LSHTYTCRPSFCRRPHLSRELTSLCCLFMSWDLITCILLSVHVPRIVHCGCVCSSVAWCGMVDDYSTTSRRSEDLTELPHNKSLKPNIFHCCFLSCYLKCTLKVVCRKHATSRKMLLSILILCGLMLFLCSLLVHDFHHSSNGSFL